MLDNRIWFEAVVVAVISPGHDKTPFLYSAIRKKVFFARRLLPCAGTDTSEDRHKIISIQCNKAVIAMARKKNG
jgi:hypothetical protein